MVLSVDSLDTTVRPLGTTVRPLGITWPLWSGVHRTQGVKCMRSQVEREVASSVDVRWRGGLCVVVGDRWSLVGWSLEGFAAADGTEAGVSSGAAHHHHNYQNQTCRRTKCH